MITKGSEYANAGPLAALFQGDAKARILDQAFILGKLEFTVSTIAEGTDLTYKTVKDYLRHLEKSGFILRTRKLGNAQAYRFNIENHMNGLVQWARNYQTTRLAQQVRS